MSDPAGADAFRVLPLDPADAAAVKRAAALLVEGFREHHPRAWPDMEAACAEVRECLNPRWTPMGCWWAGSAGSRSTTATSGSCIR